MPTLKEQFEAIHLSSRQFDDQICETTIDGCGSFCDTCVAKISGTCRGCTHCDFFNNCPSDSCGKCHIRCGQHATLPNWIEDVEGLDLAHVNCSTPFNDKLPFFMPQIRDTSFGVQHDAFFISFSRFLRIVDGDVKWLYRKKKTLREAYNIPDTTKMILHFYAKDDLLELIWRFQDMDWGNGKNLWQVFAEYGFDAAVSVNYSCFANQPRMEHVLNVKRNILSAQALAQAGIPVILDLMWHSDVDLERLLSWGDANKISWYSLNFQTLRKGNWAKELILSSLAKVFKIVPNARIIANGISEESRIKEVVATFGDKVSISNFGAFMKACSGLIYDESAGKWVKSSRTKAECWNHVSQTYIKWGQ